MVKVGFIGECQVMSIDTVLRPFINAGALAVTDTILADQSTEACIQNLLKLVQQLSDDDSIYIDSTVAESEIASTHRNASLAYFMQSFNNLHRSVDDVLNVYCHQCAIAMNCEQLARSALYLSSNGRDPLSNKRIVGNKRARRLNALMMLCGHYDASGDFAHRVGLPGKSGVGGGIVVVLPQRAAAAVWSRECDHSNAIQRLGSVNVWTVTATNEVNINRDLRENISDFLILFLKASKRDLR